MKLVIFLLALFLVACESDTITACSLACDRAGRRMERYSKDTGCVCTGEKESK